MFNKKTIAVALAAAFSTSAFAAIDLDVNTDQTVLYASEVVNTNNATEVATNASNLLDVTVDLGFSIGVNEPKYVRFDLADATFESAPALTIAGLTLDTDYSVELASGGLDEDFVIFEVSALVNDIAPTAELLLAAASYNISTTGPTTITYRLYEGSTAAANPDAATSITLKTRANVGFTDLTSANTGEFARGVDNEAIVSSEFTEFSSASLGATTATIGWIDTDLLVRTAFDLDGTPVTATDLLDDEQDITFDGDFTFGTWTLEMDPDCNAGSTLAITPVTGGGAIIEDVADTDLVMGRWYVCVDSDGDTIEKGSYSVTLEDDNLTDDLGTITYDTTTIEVPYVTTFSDYNQRIYIINNGNSDADYSFSFTAENGVTYSAKAAATGTVPAGEMLTLKAVDVVEITGRTRISATIEVEGIDSNIQAATQTINTTTGGTDTVVLNANSIVSPTTANQLN